MPNTEQQRYDARLRRLAAKYECRIKKVRTLGGHCYSVIDIRKNMEVYKCSYGAPDLGGVEAFLKESSNG
jgi:hypothetical protein